MTSVGFLKGAVTAQLGVMVTAAAVLGGGCAKPSCEETLTCPRSAGGTAGAGAAGAAAAGSGGTAGGTAGAGAGTSSASGGTAGESKGGRGGSAGSDGGTEAGRGGAAGGTSGGDAGSGGDRGGVSGTAGTSSGSQNGGAAGDEGDPCDGVACENGGTCKVSGASFKCECAAGYDGKYCQTNIDDCAGSPCMHGGTCTDGVNAYACDCGGTGYFGDQCETAHFESLGTGSFVRGISADGLVVVGSVPGVTRDVPARWTKATGFVALQSLTEPVDVGDAYAASADGSVVVGAATLASGGGAFRWTEETGLVSLGLGPTSRAVGVSATGSTVLGHMLGSEPSPQMHAFRWTTSSGVQDLVALGGGGLVYGANANGTAVVGVYNPEADKYLPFRWTQTPGVRSLSNENGVASAISLDGLSVVGSTSTAFIFRNEDGLTSLALPDLTSASPMAVNEDGTVVGGISQQGSWIWDTTNGMRLLTDVLADLSVDLTDWDISGLEALSSDGKVIAGFGYENGKMTGWIARL